MKRRALALLLDAIVEQTKMAAVARGEYEDWGQVSLCAKDDIICT